MRGSVRGGDLDRETGEELDLITGNLVTRILDHTQDVKQRGKKDQDVKNRSTQLSALHLASAANGNHDKDKEITHSACFPMCVTKEISNKGNLTHVSRTPRPPRWVAPWQVVSSWWCFAVGPLDCEPTV